MNDWLGALQMDCRPFKDSSVKLLRKQQCCGVQAVHEKADKAIQVIKRYKQAIAKGQLIRGVRAAFHSPRHTIHSSKPDRRRETRALLFGRHDELSGERLSSVSLSIVVGSCTTSLCSLEDVFLHNEVLDVLSDDFPPVDDGSGSFEGKELQMKEYQSFTDLVYSKARILAHLQWSPAHKVSSHVPR